MLKGKKVILTGATGGIGRSICELFLKNNAELFITNVSEQSLINLKDELTKMFPNSKVGYFTCNLSDKNAIVELVDKANKTMNGIDVVIGNAGITMDGLSIRMSDEQWQKVIDINLTANFILSRECAKIMMKQRSGKIINIASVVGITGNVGQANYSASKAGLISMTKCFALEYASRGITANCVAPGFIETPMTQAMTDEAKKVLMDKIPMKKIGQPIDVANACLFLASDMSRYTTGATISVNGGISMV